MKNNTFKTLLFSFAFIVLGLNSFVSAKNTDAYKPLIDESLIENNEKCFKEFKKRFKELDREYKKDDTNLKEVDRVLYEKLKPILIKILGRKKALETKLIVSRSLMSQLTAVYPKYGNIYINADIILNNKFTKFPDFIEKEFLEFMPHRIHYKTAVLIEMDHYKLAFLVANQATRLEQQSIEKELKKEHSKIISNVFEYLIETEKIYLSCIKECSTTKKVGSYIDTFFEQRESKKFEYHSIAHRHLQAPFENVGEYFELIEYETKSKETPSKEVKPDNKQNEEQTDVPSENKDVVANDVLLKDEYPELYKKAKPILIKILGENWANKVPVIVTDSENKGLGAYTSAGAICIHESYIKNLVFPVDQKWETEIKSAGFTPKDLEIKLSENVILFLIAHEAAHIKNRDISEREKSLSPNFSPFPFEVAKQNNLVFFAENRPVTKYATDLWMQHQEKRADITAVNACGTTQGGIEFVEADLSLRSKYVDLVKYPNDAKELEEMLANMTLEEFKKYQDGMRLRAESKNGFLYYELAELYKQMPSEIDNFFNKIQTSTQEELQAHIQTEEFKYVDKLIGKELFLQSNSGKHPMHWERIKYLKELVI